MPNAGFEVINRIMLHGRPDHLTFRRDIGVTPQEFAHGALHAIEARRLKLKNSYIF